MTSFRDSALLRLADPVAFRALLLPSGDSERRLVRTALAATYDLSAVRIDQVRDVVVDELVLQFPLFSEKRTAGSWTQLVPTYSRTEFVVDNERSPRPVWIDILAKLKVTVVAETDAAGVESVVNETVEGFTTFDEFRQRLPFVDLDAFMSEHGISTVEELREAFQYLLSTVRLRTAGPFDPDDPANVHTLGVAVATVAVDPFDLTEGLRAGRIITEAGRAVAGAEPVLPKVESIAPYASAVVFAETGPADGGTTVAAVEQLFAGAGVAALFLPSTSDEATKSHEQQVKERQEGER